MHPRDPFRAHPLNAFGQVLFPAQLTDVTTVDGEYVYSWEEQQVVNGAYAEHTSPRMGDSNSNGAREINNRLVEVPSYVWMRLRGGNGGDLVYEFEAGGGDPTILAQLVYKAYEEGGSGDGGQSCVTYYGVQVRKTDETLCNYEIVGNLCGAIRHERGLDVPVCPPPSPWASYPAIAEETESPSGTPWENLDNAEGECDSGVATNVLGPTQETRRLKLRKLCYKLLENREPTLVRVSVTHQASDEGIVDTEVKLLVNGAVVGTSAHTGAAIPHENSQTRVYVFNVNGSGELALTAEDVSNDDFGVVIRYSNSNESGDDVTVQVDCAEFELEFSPSGIIAPLSTFRLREVDGGGYITSDDAWTDYFFRSGDSDAGGEIAYHYRWNQTTQAWEEGLEVRLRLVGE